MNFLAHLEEADRDKLLRLGELRQYMPDQALVSQGSGLDALFVLHQGQANVERSDFGHTFVVAELGPGDVVGEIALLDGQPTSAAVIAVTSLEAHVIAHAALREFLHFHSGFSARLHRALALTLAGKLRGSTESVYAEFAEAMAKP
jgi:CRP-like cAMP-binding protein